MAASGEHWGFGEQLKIRPVVVKGFNHFRLLFLLLGGGLFLGVVPVFNVLLDAHGDGLINFLVRRGQCRILADQNAGKFLHFGCGRRRLQRFRRRGKAHPRVLDVFLQILDAARVTMASGDTLDFSKHYIVLTSNIGAAEILHIQHSTQATMERHVLTRAQQSLRPEMFARITEKLVFNRLTYDNQLEIAGLLLTNELKFLRDKGHELAPNESVLPFLVRRGFHPKLGARPMRDAIEKLVGDAVSTDLLTGGKACGQLTVEESFLSIRK